MKRVEKVWGHELWIVNKDYCGKLLFFKKGHFCSFHYHRLKEECFFLSLGKMIIRSSWGDDLAAADEILLSPGERFEVPVGLRHQMEALEDSYLYEFSTHHEDSDSYRISPGA